MKIALMTNNYKPVLGGVPISIERLANGLRNQGHQVTIFAPTYENQVEEEGVFRYKTLLSHFVGGIVLPNPIDPEIEKEFERQQFDVIHVHHPFLIGRTARYLSKKYNIPLVFTYHTRYEQYLHYVKGMEHFKWIVPLYLKPFIRKCDFVIAPTRSIEDYLMKTYAGVEEKIGILPTGINQKDFEVPEYRVNRLRKAYGIHNDETLFLFVSRIAKEKNIDFLINCIDCLKKKTDKPFKVLFVGDGPQLRELEEDVRKRGIDNIVIFAGRVPNEDTSVYYKAADAFIFSSKTETQGIVILEALASGTPVLAIKATGVSDLVFSGYNGYLTNENEEEYVHILEQFLNKKDWRDFLTSNTVESVKGYYEDAIAQKAYNFYNYAIVEKNAAEHAFTGWRAYELQNTGR